jgi:hypothetical protein
MMINVPATSTSIKDQANKNRKAHHGHKDNSMFISRSFMVIFSAWMSENITMCTSRGIINSG